MKDPGEALGTFYSSLYYRQLGVPTNNDEVSVALVVEVVGTYALEGVLWYYWGCWW